MTADQINRLIVQLHLHEGLRLKPYKDTMGKITIGVGRNLTDVGISRAEADDLLRHDLDRTLADCEALPFWDRLDPVRQRVVADMMFNMGSRTFHTFVHTIELISEGKYVEAGHAMLRSAWAYQVGHRAERLAEMMISGNDFTA